MYAQEHVVDASGCFSGAGTARLQCDIVAEEGVGGNQRFDGVERMSFRAEKGDKIQLDFDLQVEEGSLAINLEDPDGNQVWSMTYQEDAQESASLNAPQNGRYYLRVEGEAAEGGYEIGWDVEG